MIVPVVESSLAVGFCSSSPSSSIPFSGVCRPFSNFSAVIGGDPIALYIGCCRRASQASPKFFNKGIDHATHVYSKGLRGNGLTRGANLLKRNIAQAASPGHSDSMSDPLEFSSSKNPCYHPFEEIGEPVAQLGSEQDARLTDAETTRTMIEVNSKAMLMFSGVIDDEVHENVIWPELHYVTDEHGDIYFKVNSNEDIMQTLTADNSYVQVLIGLDKIETFNEMELSGQSDIDFGIEEFSDEDGNISDDDDDGDDDDGDDDSDDEEDWVAFLEDGEDELGSSDTLGDWANLETMRSSHPMYFARRIAEVVSNPHLDWMDQPSMGLAIQGVLRPAFVEEQSTIQKHMTGQLTEKLEKDGSLRIGTSFYKLEMISIQLVSPYGSQSLVNIKDYRQAQPDVIAHLASKIISRLKTGGEKIVQALKSLCWRCKGILVEEVAPIGVDSLGFDLRVCSGTQVQTLRFTFGSRATSEYSAERQLHDLLFPRIHPKLHESRRNES